MYILKIENNFDSAHFLNGYNGKCSNIHGHRWKIETEIQSSSLIKTGEKRGMVEDFNVIKKDIKDTFDFYDHSLIIEKGSMRELTLNCLKEDGFKIIELNFRPTAENFSKFFFDKIKKMGYDVKSVTVFETPNNCACYTKEEV
ncbi:MAG: 6-carboxytetrahydropterin synthase [Clostridium sp.]|nr:6-carboxytetrahydropterin synthase [Clostridium sp.]